MLEKTRILFGNIPQKTNPYIHSLYDELFNILGYKKTKELI